MSKFLNKESILSFNDIKVEKVLIPEWDGFLYVRTISGADRDMWEEWVKTENGIPLEGKLNFKNARAKFAVLVCCDEKGERIFNNTDVEQLTKKSGSGLDRIFEAGSKINKMNQEALDETEKN